MTLTVQITLLEIIENKFILTCYLEVAKLRGKIPVQHISGVHDASTSYVQVVEEPNFGANQSNLDEEQAVNSDINSNNVQEEIAPQSNGAQVAKNRGLTIEEAAGEMEADNSEERDEEAVDNPSGTGCSEVPNQCPQCTMIPLLTRMLR